MFSSSPTASLALLVWPLAVYLVFRRYPAQRAAMYCFLGGVMFLPELAQIKLPLMPGFGKHNLTNLSLLVMLFAVRKPRSRAEPWLLLFLPLGFAGAVGSWLTNQETVVFGQTVLSGLTFKDSMFVLASDLTGGWLAAYVGMRTFRDENDLNAWVRALAMAGLVYAPFLLIEMRVSPQFHRWLYGFHPNDDFNQVMRHGGIRPMAFMAHGLATALFMLATAVAGCVLARQKTRVWKLSGSQAAWALGALAFLCKSTGVWFYMIAILPLVRWARAKTLARAAVVLAVLTCAYPWLRTSGDFPVEKVLEYASIAGEERMLSLKFRFDNEDLLINHAMEKPWFGWSWNYGRNMVHDDEGKVLTITDGGWIIAFGGGIFGIVNYMGVVVLGILVVARRIRRIRDPKAQATLASLNLLVAVMWLDTLPNGNFNLLPHFLGGALCSISRRLAAKRDVVQARSQPTQPVSQASELSPVAAR